MRIRSLKPEFWTDEKTTGTWPIDMKIVYEGLWSVADDYGRIEWSPRQIRAAVFPYYPEGAELTSGGPALDFDSACERIAATGRLRFYEVNGQRYGLLPRFREHQHPQKPTAKYPPPPPEESSVESVPTPVQEPSRTPPVPILDGEEGSGVERRGGGSRTPPVPEPLTLPGMPAPPASEEALLTFPCKASKKSQARVFHVTPSLVASLESEFPGVDVLAEVRKAHRWVQANEPKTAPGMPLFLTSWLERSRTNRQSSKQNGDTEIERLEQLARQEWATARFEEPSGDGGRGVRAPGKDAADPNPVPTPGVDHQAAEGIVHGGRGKAGCV